MQTGASEKGDCGKHKFHRDHGKKTGSWCSREVTGGKGETRANRGVWIAGVKGEKKGQKTEREKLMRRKIAINSITK